jgi:hypothetical protein
MSCTAVLSGLQESGVLNLADLAITYSLNTELLRSTISSRMGSIIQGQLEGGLLYTPAYVRNIKAQLRGALRGTAAPVALTALVKSIGTPPRLDVQICACARTVSVSPVLHSFFCSKLGGLYLCLVSTGLNHQRLITVWMQYSSTPSLLLLCGNLSVCHPSPQGSRASLVATACWRSL